MDIGSLTGAIALEDQLSNRLTLMSSHIQKFADRFNGMTGIVVAGAGAIVAAVAGAVVSIVTLGDKGSTILGVEDAFNKLALAAGSTGDMMLSALSTGVRGTVDSMELMQSTTRLLSSGLKVSTTDLNLMAKVAREMGKATGTDAADGLNVLTQAMISGNARALRRYGIQLDLVSAEKQFRASVGNTTDALSAAGKLEVNRIAVMAAAKIKLDQYGESQLSFKERVQQASVSLSNWFDNLAKSVASSTHVSAAFDAISNAITKTFGVTSQTLLEWIVKWVNRFADAVATYGPPAIAWIGKIKDGIIHIWQTVVRAWDLVPDWFKNLAKEAAIAGGAVYLTSAAFSALGGGGILETTASFATITSGIIAFGQAAIGIIPAAVLHIKSLYSALSVYYLLGSFAGGGFTGGIIGLFTGIGAGITVLAATPVGLAATFAALGAAIWQVVRAIQAFGENWKAGGGTLWGFLTLKDDDNFVRRWLGLSTAIDKAAASARKFHLTTEIAPGALAVGSAEFQAAQAERRRLEEAKQGRGLTGGFFKEDTSAADAYAERLKEVNKEIAEYKVGADVLSDANMNSIDSYTELGLKVDSIAVKLKKPAIAIAAYLAELEKQKTAQTEVFATEERLAAFRNAFTTQARTDRARQAADELRLNQERAANMASIEAVTKDYAQRNKERLLTGTALELEKLRVVKAEAMANLEARSDAHTAAWDLAVAVMDAYFVAEEARIKKSVNVFAETFSQIPGILQSAFEGGGGIAGALKSIAVHFGEDFGKAMSDAIKKQLKAGSSAISGTSAGAAAAMGALAVGTSIASGASTGQQVGSAVSTAVAVGQMAKLAGATTAVSIAFAAYTAGAGLAVIAAYKIYKGMNDGRKVMQDYYKTFKGGADEVRQRMLVLGDAGEEMWKKLTQQTGKGDKKGAQLQIAAIEMALLRQATYDAAGGFDTLNQRALTAGTTLKSVLDAKTPEAYKAAIDELNLAFEFQDSAMKLLDDTAAKYGLTLSEMGPKYRQGKLDEAFAELFQDQKILQAGGVDYDLILRKQADSYKSLIQTALETGSTIPKAMKESIDRMDKLGLFTDEAGKAMFDLTKLTFAETLDAKFETLITTIGRLVDAIERGLGGALANLNNTVISPRVVGPPRPRPDAESGEDAYASGRVLAFTPRSMDSVIPAGRGSGGGTAIIKINARTLAEIMVPELPGVVQEYGLG